MIPPVFAGHAALLQEPWGFTPDQVAKLSIRQVRELYLKPAADRAERMDTKGKGGVHLENDRMATFDEYAGAIGPHAKPGSDLKRMYAKYVTAWKKERGQ